MLRDAGGRLRGLDSYGSKAAGMSELRIEIVGWERFQHYRDRNPPWVKNYLSLMSNRNYLNLSFRMRGILHGLWLLYAASGRDLGASPAQLGRMLGDSSVRMRDLERLNHAGFIRISASGTLASRARSRDVEAEVQKQKPASPAVVQYEDFETLAELIGRQAGFSQADQDLREDEPWS